MKTVIFSIISASFLLTASSGQNETYSIYAIFDQQAACIYLNGFPLLKNDGSGDGSAASTSHLNPLVIQGQNSFRVELTDRTDPDNDNAPIPGILNFHLERGPMDDDQRLRFFSLERQTRLREALFEELVSLTCDSSLNAEARGILDLKRSLITLDDTTPAYTYSQLPAPGVSVIEFTFTAENVPLTTLPWLSQPVLLNPAEEAAILAVVTDLHSKLTNKDTPGILTAISNKTERLAVGLEVSLEQMEANLGAIWALLFDDPAFIFAPLDPANLQFKIFPDINLVEVTGPNDTPPIAGSGGGKEFTLPLFFSKLEGVWTIVD